MKFKKKKKMMGEEEKFEEGHIEFSEEKRNGGVGEVSWRSVTIPNCS